MFKKVFASGLDLTIGDLNLRFESAREFDFALTGRTGVMPTKVRELLSRTDEALLKEAEAIRGIEKQLDAVLSDSMEKGSLIGHYLQRIDLSVVSSDNEWRTIIAALNQTDEETEEFKRTALVKYMQYLTSRQDTIRAIYADRLRQREGALEPEKIPAGGNGRLRDTLIFDVTSFAEPEAQEKDEFDRLPKGEGIDIPLLPHRPVTVLLAKHRFRLLREDGIHFLDEKGSDSRLKRGKNIVGRDVSSDVVIDQDCRDVSRKHLIIEMLDEDLVKLTDISSLGTFVSPEYLDRTGG